MHTKKVVREKVNSLEEAEMRIRLGQTIYTTGAQSERGIGKTSLLAEIAEEEGLCLIVNNAYLVNDLKDTYPNALIIPVSEIQSLRGVYAYGKHILIDENTKENQESLTDFIHTLGCSCGGFQIDYHT